MIKSLCDNFASSGKVAPLAGAPGIFTFGKFMENENPTQPQFFRWENDQLMIDLLVQPFASHDEVVGIHGNRLKIRLACPPAAGKANEHLIKLLADYYGVPQNRVHITKGHQSRMKQICVNNPQQNLPQDDEQNNSHLQG